MTRSLSLAAVLALATLPARDAAALGSLSGGEHVPIEQRIAIALGPSRTTLWTQLRVDTIPGPFAIVVPADPGAALDWSSPAWMEALEIATAPRILPPDGVEPACPGEAAASALHVAGDLYHHDPLDPIEVVVLADPDALVQWAEQHGMPVSTDTWAALLAVPGARFVAARFASPGGVVHSPTLRVTGPAVWPGLPLVLTQATEEDLLVTTFVLGEGRASFDGPSASLGPISFDAASGDSSYQAARSEALGSSAEAWLLESGSRTALDGSIDLGEGEYVPGALVTYFTRAALYTGGAVDGQACAAQAKTALASTEVVAASCPRGDLGVVDGGDGCAETVPPGTLDPDVFRCSVAVDDLAVALSGLVPASTWLSRIAVEVPAFGQGSWRTVASAPGAAVDPVLRASSLDVSGCDGGAGGGSQSSGSGPGSSSASGGPTEVQVPVYRVESGCGAEEVGDALYVVTVLVAEDETAPDAYYQQEDCNGDTSESYTPVYYDEEPDVSDSVGEDADGYDSGGDCEGDSSETYDDGGDCEGDSSESYDENGDCEGDTGESYEGDDCGSDGSEGDDCGGDASDGGDGCSGDGTSSTDTGGCGGDSGGDCSIGRRRPRLSVLVLAALAVVAPLRRLSRPGRKPLSRARRSPSSAPRAPRGRRSTPPGNRRRR